MLGNGVRYSLLQNNRILPANITSVVSLLNFNIRIIKIYYINYNLDLIINKEF